MAFIEKALGQVRPSIANTMPQLRGTGIGTVLVACGADERIIVRTMWLTNTTDGGVWYSIWHDIDGSTTDGTTAILNSLALGPYKAFAIDMYMVMDNSSSRLQVAASQANAINFSCYGAVFT